MASQKFQDIKVQSVSMSDYSYSLDIDKQEFNSFSYQGTQIENTSAFLEQTTTNVLQFSAKADSDEYSIENSD